MNGEGNDTPLQYSCLENPMDGGAWWAAVNGVAGGQTQLSDFTFTFHFSLSCIGEGNGNPLQCSCLENPRDRGAWWAAIYGVAQSWTRLKRLSSSRTLWGWVSPLISGYWSESLPACTQGRRKSISNPPILQIGMNYDSKHGLFMYIFCVSTFYISNTSDILIIKHLS